MAWALKWKASSLPQNAPVGNRLPFADFQCVQDGAVDIVLGLGNRGPG